MKTHIDKRDILLYVQDQVSDALRGKIHSHLLACHTCVFKVAHAYAVKKNACEIARNLFEDYKDGKLDKIKKESVRLHLILCDACNNEYDDFLRSAETSGIEVLLKNLKKKSLDSFDLPQEKTSGSLKKGMPYYEYNKAGINLGLFDNKQGNLTVYLKSKEYDVSNVTVSLGARTKEGFNPIMTAVTTKKGTAVLGRKDKIGTLEDDYDYSLYVSGLKKKIK